MDSSDIPVCHTDQDGNQYWSIHGQFHRVDGPAVILGCGTIKWYQNDVLHREDGPAFQGALGICEWWIHGSLHREDGPAAISASGEPLWYLESHYYELNDWLDLVDLTEEEKIMIKLEYG